MLNNSPKLPPGDILKEAAKFLDRDFNQCFQQMRHYDSQGVDLCKFAFTAYSAVVGLAFALFRYGVAEKIDYTLPAAVTLCVGLAFGLCFFAMMVRNRVYFVVVARYVNEHRGFFLKSRPLGFENHSKMFTNFEQPPFFHWRSSQAFLFYVMSALNGFLAGAALHFLAFANSPDWRVTISSGGLVFFAQVLLAARYLSSREAKSSSKAVFAAE